MEKLRGVVASTRFDVLVSQKEGTLEVVEFEIASRRARWESRRRADISDGDELIVAGKSSGEVLKIWAYRNLTNGTASHQNMRPSPILRNFAIVLLILGLSALAFVLLTPWARISLVLVTLSGSFLLSGIVLLYVTKNMRDAINLIYYDGRGGA